MIPFCPWFDIWLVCRANFEFLDQKHVNERRSWIDSMFINRRRQGGGIKNTLCNKVSSFRSSPTAWHFERLLFSIDMGRLNSHEWTLLTGNVKEKTILGVCVLVFVFCLPPVSISLHPRNEKITKMISNKVKNLKWISFIRFSPSRCCPSTDDANDWNT